MDKVLRGKDVVIQAAATTSGSKDIVKKPYIHVTDNAVINSYILRSSYENANKFFYISQLFNYVSFIQQTHF